MVTYEELPALISLLDGDEKHDPSSYSTLDVLWVLYDRVLNVDPARPNDPDRDRFLLSKGHGPAAYYSILAARGFIAPESLAGFATYDSPLGHHPDRNLIPGVEISSGSLGHGLPIAVGMALALDAQERSRPHDKAALDGSSSKLQCRAVNRRPTIGHTTAPATGAWS